MEWLIVNWKECVDAVTYIVTGASIVANITPWQWDNKLIAKLVKFLALNIR